MAKRRLIRAAGLLFLALALLGGLFFVRAPLLVAPTAYEARALAVMACEGAATEELLEQILRGEREEGGHFRVEGDVAPEPGREIIVGASLSKDRGAVGIFSMAGEQPRLLASLATLPLQEIKVVEIEPGLCGILLRELLDERFGAYFYTVFYTLYTYEEGACREIWRKVVSNEESWQKKWLGGGEGWQGVKDTAEVEFAREDGRLVIKTRETRVLWEGPEPGGSPTGTRERSWARVYRWEPRWKAMILGEGVVEEDTFLQARQGNRYVPLEKLAAGERLAILDEEEGWDAMGGAAAEFYRVKTAAGSVGFVGKEAVSFRR
ncbi:MAG: hypothetical protein IMW96_08360 [Thermoanaerobacteraceae bacterium]|nr:hypothetical protein [Thermoanaerobacteraceae bacterium]